MVAFDPESATVGGLEVMVSVGNGYMRRELDIEFLDKRRLRERLVGQRYYDNEADEAFTVIGVTSHPPLVLLQYDDGASWDEGASNFTFNEDSAQKLGLEGDGLDSERYHPLGSGPSIEQICHNETHEWFPWPDELWPNVAIDDLSEQIPDGHHNRRELYRRSRPSASGLDPEGEGRKPR